jgi:large subunit ribosomal protein L25
MTEIILKAEPRVEMKGGNPKRMLKDDILPIVVYGPGSENLNLKVNYQEFLKVLSAAGESTVVDLSVGDKTMQVLIHKVQKNPVTDKVIHVDLYQFDKKKKFSVEVPINFVGESKAVKEGGVLVTNINSILAECLYTDLISEIKVDLSVLENINDSIYVSDLKVSEGVNFLTSKDQIIVAVKPMRAQEVIEDTKPEEEGAEGEEGEEGAEGEEGEKKTEGDSEKTDEGEKKE